MQWYLILVLRLSLKLRNIKIYTRGFGMSYKNILSKAVLKKFGESQEKLDWWYSKHSSARRTYLCKLWDADPHCVYCKRLTIRPDGSINNSGLRATYEHKIPLIRGGTDNRSNATLSCSTCNNMKGSYTHDEFINLLESGDLRKIIAEKRNSKKHKKFTFIVSEKIEPKRKDKVMRIAFYISLLMFDLEVKNFVKNLIEEKDLIHNRYMSILNKRKENDSHAEEICRTWTVGSGA